MVDDDRTFRLSTAELLRQDGHDVDVAADAAEAVERLATGAFDLVLLDMRMPGMDGSDRRRGPAGSAGCGRPSS